MNLKSGWGTECASYHEVDTYADANAQIRGASALISKKTNGLVVPLFLHFPYNHYNDYLYREYLSNHIGEHGLAVAFSTEGRYISDQITCRICRDLFADYIGNRRKT